MIFKPVNEKHLEHLISSKFFTDNCKLEYFGPVLNVNNRVSESPDMLLLDKRNDKAKFKTCECKYSPTSHLDFQHNGNFDLAILWECNIDLEKLKNDLYKQNNCNEIIVLKNENVFSKLPEYKNYLINNQSFNTSNIDKLIFKLKKGKEYTSFVAYIAAKMYPKKISAIKLIELLKSNFEEVRNMQPKGISNATSALTQVINRGNSDRILLKQGNNSYKWNNELIDSNLALSIIIDIIHNYFNGKIPSDDDLKYVEM